MELLAKGIGPFMAQVSVVGRILSFLTVAVHHGFNSELVHILPLREEDNGMEQGCKWLTKIGNSQKGW